MSAYDKARAKFDEYAATDSPETPSGTIDMSRLQVELTRWEARQFGGGTTSNSTHGVNEEVGELAESLIYLAAMKTAAGRLSHAVLKRGQKIRGYDDKEKYRKAIADAVADTIIFAIQVATKNRIDAGVILSEVAADVMDRDWRENPDDGLAVATAGVEVVRIGEGMTGPPGEGHGKPRIGVDDQAEGKDQAEDEGQAEDESHQETKMIDMGSSMGILSP